MFMSRRIYEKMRNAIIALALAVAGCSGTSVQYSEGRLDQTFDGVDGDYKPRTIIIDRERQNKYDSVLIGTDGKDIELAMDTGWRFQSGKDKLINPFYMVGLGLAYESKNFEKQGTNLNFYIDNRAGIEFNDLKKNGCSPFMAINYTHYSNASKINPFVDRTRNDGINVVRYGIGVKCDD